MHNKNYNRCYRSIEDTGGTDDLSAPTDQASSEMHPLSHSIRDCNIRYLKMKSYHHSKDPRRDTDSLISDEDNLVILSPSSCDEEPPSKHQYDSESGGTDAEDMKIIKVKPKFSCTSKKNCCCAHSVCCCCASCHQRAKECRVKHSMADTFSSKDTNIHNTKNENIKQSSS